MLRDLKADVQNSLEEAVNVVPLSEEDATFAGYDISTDNPVQCLPVPGGWRIVVLNSLSQIQLAEAIAHELGHLLLKAEGLASISIGYGDDWEEDYLASEVNSVLAHHFIVPRLERDYGLDSSLILSLRKGILTDGEEIIGEYSEEPVMLHAIGLHLLDLSKTVQGKNSRIGGLLEISSYVKEAFRAGEELLIYPRPDLPHEEQWQRLKNFLVRLGYNPEDARLIG